MYQQFNSYPGCSDSRPGETITRAAKGERDDNQVNAAYAGWPDRFAIVDTDGKIAYYGEKGPKGFTPNEVEQWLEANVK